MCIEEIAGILLSFEELKNGLFTMNSTMEVLYILQYEEI